MRKVLRFKDNSDYWDERWASSGVDDNKFEKLDFYPIKQCEYFFKNYAKEESILEIGSGAGRLFFHYKNLGYDISGIEYSEIAVENIQNKMKNNDVICGSVVNLPYSTATFDYAIAMGLYHNLENSEDLENAFRETSRVLKVDGKLLFSVRFDSLENNIVEEIIKKRNPDKKFDKFHRMHFDMRGIEYYLKKNNLKLLSAEYVRNVSFLFKYDFFRNAQMKSGNFNEKDARSKGFELNAFGNFLDRVLHYAFPKYFSNLLVITAQKR